MADRNFRVAVAGAGVSGLFMAEQLRRAGIDFTVYEKAGEVGGTWRDNTFPGLFVDVLSRQYEFPFQPNYNWSRKYAPAAEIRAYIKKVARDRGLTKFIRFNEEIVAARFTDGCWQIETAQGNKAERNTDVADVFICATGFLHKPLFPDIPGRESFAGRSFHSAHWDHSVPYAGKRWGVIGSGASGVQITEALAWAGCDVTQFIRRAQWVHIRDNPYSTWRERLKLRLPGGYQREQRRLWQMINEGDSWRLRPGPQREAMEREYRSYLDLIKDPELKEKLTPDYNLGCTRIPKSDKNYYAAVQLPNAHIVKGQIASIVPDGIVMADGSKVELDVLVYATGFDAHAYMRPMRVTGLNGTTIDEAWKEQIYSYGGIALPGFPNLFMLYGPFAPGQQRAGAAGPRPGDRLHHAAHCRGPRPPRRGRADRRRDREIPRPPWRRLSRHRLGRRLQELVHRRSGHADPVAIAAERAQGVLRRGAERKIFISLPRGRETDLAVAPKAQPRSVTLFPATARIQPRQPPTRLPPDPHSAIVRHECSVNEDSALSSRRDRRDEAKGERGVRLTDFPDISDLALDKTAFPDDGRSEPVLVAAPRLAEFAEAMRLDPTRVDVDLKVQPPERRLCWGPIGSLLLHLLPLLAISGWPRTRTEIAMPIPIQLVIEQPRLPPKPAESKPAAKPPSGRLASDDFAEVVAPEVKPGGGEPLPKAGEPQAPSAETRTVLVAPPLPTPAPIPLNGLGTGEPLPLAAETQTAAVAPPALPPKAAPLERRAAVRMPKPLGSEWPLPLHQGPPNETPRAARLLGPPAIRDKYSALALSLTLRHIDLLPRSLTGARQGETRLTIRVLGDGTINSVTVARSSGYPEIDQRIEQMVLAVGRFPPLPLWMGPWMDFTFNMHFPHPLQR